MTILKRPLLGLLLNGDKFEINLALSQYKERGAVKFDKVLAIPREQRIPTLTNTPEGMANVVTALSASMKSAFDNLNLRVGLSADQIVEIAYQIVDESNEDHLSLEDVLLFLQQLITGKAGKIYDRLDMPTFFELFENYRQERHKKLLSIREEQKAQHKTYGDTGERLSDNQDREKEIMRSALGDYLKDKYKDK